MSHAHTQKKNKKKQKDGSKKTWQPINDKTKTKHIITNRIHTYGNILFELILAIEFNFKMT